MKFNLCLAEIEKSVGNKIDCIRDIYDKQQQDIYNEKKRWKLVMSDGKEYILKKINIPKSRIEEYKNICEMNIRGFQKILRFYNWGWENEYYILAEWITGDVFTPSGICESDEKIMIKKMSGQLKEIHLNNKVSDRVYFSKSDVEKIVKQDFLPEKTQKIILSYMIEKLPIINSRYKTVVHGDVHLKNILITREKNVIFIDLDDVCWGDPFMDLVYASNIIISKSEWHVYYLFLKYYFGNNLPPNFWPIVNFYTLCKGIDIMKAEIAKSLYGKPLFSIDNLIDQHEGMKQEKPMWYKQMEKVDEKRFKNTIV